ncbi:MAG: hypothetical protein R3266_09885 [Gemmatimonadota bacterium]|nr:hypothetical protein [Gemmatimonadota bacterium]
MNRFVTQWMPGALLAAVAWTGCGGGDPVSPPPPGPPPPPPPPPTAVTLDLAPGDVATLTDPSEVRAFRLSGADEPRDYEIIVQSAAETPGVTQAMRLHIQAGGAGGSASRVAADPASPSARRGFDDRELALRRSSLDLETGLRESMWREFERAGASPLRPGLDVSASIAAGSTPQLGQVMSFGFGVVGSGSGVRADCNSGVTVDAEVKFVGQNFTIVEDLQLAGEFTNADYQEIGQQLDDVVFPTVTGYFGNTADLDNNNTVFALITAEVNKLTEENSGSIIAGFFFTGDLDSKQDCAASNEGEIFYLIGPDPAPADFGEPIELDFANTLARTTVAHEFLHLINTHQRLVLGGGGVQDREDPWLDEGLAHVAEEITGFAELGEGTRENLDLDPFFQSQQTLDAFNDFHRLNLSRFAEFLYDGPHATQALGDATGEDPGGTASLPFRGFAYGFARWLGDQYGPPGNGVLPGSQEHLLFRELSSGGPSLLRGIANVERAVQVVGGSNAQWDELLADYLASLIVDDRGIAGIDPRTQILSWNLRGLFDDLRNSNLGMDPPFNRPYPLVPFSVGLSATTNQTLSFTVNGSTGRYVTVSGAATTPDVVFELTDSAGGTVPSSARPQVTIIRRR